MPGGDRSPHKPATLSWLWSSVSGIINTIHHYDWYEKEPMPIKALSIPALEASSLSTSNILISLHILHQTPVTRHQSPVTRHQSPDTSHQTPNTIRTINTNYSYTSSKTTNSGSQQTKWFPSQSSSPWLSPPLSPSWPLHHYRSNHIWILTKRVGTRPTRRVVSRTECSVRWMVRRITKSQRTAAHIVMGKVTQKPISTRCLAHAERAFGGWVLIRQWRRSASIDAASVVGQKEGSRGRFCLSTGGFLLLDRIRLKVWMKEFDRYLQQHNFWLSILSFDISKSIMLYSNWDPSIIMWLEFSNVQMLTVVSVGSRWIIKDFAFS